MAEEVVTETQPGGIQDMIADYLANAIDKTDEDAARERVLGVQRDNPNASVDELVTLLINNKCLRTGIMGALSPMLRLIGIPLNLGLVFKWQAELVLEIAALYSWTLSKSEKQRVVLIVTGFSVASTQGARLINLLISKVAHRYFLKSKTGQAIVTPGVNSIVGAASNVLITYYIGKRALQHVQQLQAEAVSQPEVQSDLSQSENAPQVL